MHRAELERNSFSRWAKVVAGLAAISVIWNAVSLYNARPRPVIKVGILHSRTGTMALRELPVSAATLMAINEINQKGGLLGRHLEPIVVDGKSDLPTFVRGAEKLILEDKADIVFGCWTSASRKAVKPIFEKYNHLLFYPVQYEGLEQSPNIVYTGAVTNQQALPATFWCMNKFGKRIFLIGSDYVFPHAANTIVKEFVPRLGGDVVGEEYLLLGAEDVRAIVQKIVDAKPDFILNTINGSTNISFFKELRSAVRGKKIPVMSLSVDDSLVASIGIENIAGSYTCWNYYEAIDSAINKQFILSLKTRYGKSQTVTDPMEAAYIGVHLWADAVAAVGTTKPDAVLAALNKKPFKAPEGFVGFNAKNQHLFKTVRIAQINSKGTSDIVWDSQAPITPHPYPTTLFIARELGSVRTVQDWEKWLYFLYLGWGESWSAS